MNEENNEQLEDKVIEETEVENVKKEEKVKTKELEDLNDRYKRLFAEFENYKKRTQKESLTKRAEITGDVVSSILPVMDNLEKAAEVQTEDKNYQEGIKLVVKQFADVLGKFGMTEIETIGHKFDPELHEAVSHIEDPSKSEGEIVQEYRKGYKIGNKVVRHSMVIVAN
ncbi:MAG: nucleotide exchange factor GrpE [Clostridia bacterium]|nr:nucleotide exchange factor GrpE [Clostridia bacterium]